MKTFSRLVTLGAVVSGAGGVLLAMSAPEASASPSVSATNTLITSPESVTISAHVDPLNTAQLLFNGVQVASVKNPVNFGQTLSYRVNAAQLGNGSYPVEEVEKTAGLLKQTARTTITVRIPPAKPASSSSGSSGSSRSGGSGPSSAHSGAVSSGSGGSSGGSGSAGGSGSGSAPAVIGYNGPGQGGTGFGSSYSRLDALSGGSSLVLPDVAPKNGFQLPVKPTRQARLASSPSRGTSLTAATWLIGAALALIMLLTAAHTGAWARRRRRLNAATATAGSARTTTASDTTETAATPDGPRGAARHRRLTA